MRSKHQDPAQTRIRVATHTRLAERFIESVNRLRDVHKEHRINVKGDLERLLRTVNPDAEEERIQGFLTMSRVDRIVHESEKLNEMEADEKQGLFEESEYLQSQNNNIMELASRIDELSGLRHEVYVLIVTQEKLVEGVEYKIDETKGEGEKGEKQGWDWERAWRRKKATVLVVMIILVVAVSIAMLVTCIPIWVKDRDGTTAISSGNAVVTRTPTLRVSAVDGTKRFDVGSDDRG